MADLSLDEFDLFEKKTELTETASHPDAADALINTYSDYNLLFDEDISLLGDGFHSKTTSTDSRFDTHPRTLIYYGIMATLLAANFLFFAQVLLCVINILIHSVLLVYASIIKYYTKHQEQKIYYLKREASSTSPKEEKANVDRLSCEEIQSQKSDKHFQHSYTNAMNWILGISNTFETVPMWLSWFLPGLMLHCEVMLLIILIVWGTETAPGQYCKNGYPLNSEPDFKSGGCLIQKEIALFFGLCALLGIIASLGVLYDISPQSMKSIELAKKRITRLFEENPFQHDYFAQMEADRQRFIKPLWKKPKSFYFIIIVNIIWSLHLLYWEPKLIMKISKEYITAAICLYVLNVVGFVISSYIIIDSMFTNKNIYKNYWVSMQIFARPLRVKRLEDIRIWQEMRKLHMNYYMVIYFGLSNGVVVSYVVIELICVLIGIYWTFGSSQGLHVFSVPTLAILAAGIIFTGYVLRIFAMCADISNIKKLHISMLQQEKQRICWISYIKGNDADDKSNAMLKAIDDVCKELELYDKPPRIVGIPMTWSLYNVMLAYAVSGCVSILTASLFANN